MNFFELLPVPQFLSYKNVLFQTSTIIEQDLATVQLYLAKSAASVRLYIDKPAADLLWTNLQVVWEYPFSDQWEPKQDNQTDPHQPITLYKNLGRTDRYADTQTDTPRRL
jgi:hypothetical protein